MKLAFYSIKGGSSKTTLTILSAYEFAAQGKRVLVIDTDPQASATRVLLGEIPEKTLTHALLDRETLPIYKTEVERVSCCPSSLGLAKLGQVDQNTFKRYDDIFDTFDVVIFDCPPIWSGLVAAVLTAVDKVLIPAQISRFDFEAVGFVQQELADIGTPYKVILTRAPRKATKYEAEYLESFDVGNLFGSRLPESASVRRIIDRGEKIGSKSHAALSVAVSQIAKEVSAWQS